MSCERFHTRVVLASAMCVAMLSSAEMLHAVGFSEFVDPNPAAGNQFGHTVVALSTGNVVITSPFDDLGGSNAGAVYLFNGATGALISTLRGSSVGDSVGSGGVVTLANGNYVVVSPGCNNGATTNAGAVTWGSGTTGVSGTVSAANSLVGSAANDRVGSNGVTVLASGHYVVASALWDNGAMGNAGAVTWGSSTTGVSGTVSAANSLVGSAGSDFVGSGGVTALSSGHYVVASPNWDNGGIANAGAVTWASGTTGVSGTVSSANSLVGSTSGDLVGAPGVTALTNGNYVVRSSSWDNGAFNAAGAVTWANGSTGVSGTISAANSMIGAAASDNVGSGGVTALSNGNFVAVSPLWNNVAVADAGAVSWGNGTIGANGTVSAANSLVGSTASDRVGASGVTPLTNGNYVVGSQFWANGVIVGAATWGSGTSGVSGTVSAANSLIGSTSADAVGNNVTALTNGSYVVVSPSWDNVGAPNAGAVTWGSGTSGAIGTVSAVNSLVGSTLNDNVGIDGVTPLTNGNYVVASANWDNGAVAGAGAVTWGSGTSGANGTVSAGNSLVGSTLNDNVGADGVTALTNGNYVVASHLWDRGGLVSAGAVTWGNGTTGVSGPVSIFNSLVGSSAGDGVGSEGVAALTNGNYVVRTPLWNSDKTGLITNDEGAVTWGSGTTGVSGSVSEANSLVGSSDGDQLGLTGLAALTNGGYVVVSSNWSNGVNLSAGAATWGSGFAPLLGEVTAANSLIGGGTVNAGLQAVVVEDPVNGTFLARFLLEGGGRVRVRWADGSPVLVSAIDVPDDQGGWLRLTLARSILDDVSASPQVATYGVWRHVPGTIAARAREARASEALAPRPDPHAIERIRPLLPPGVESWEVEGQLYVTASGSPSPENATGFPPGTWVLLASVPAAQQAQYVAELPTLSNAPYDYVVTAHTTVPSNWYISDVMSGQSLDNLAPAQPTQFTAALTIDRTLLNWAPNLEQDLASYRLYRGTSADFTPSPGNRIASPTSTNHGDIGQVGGYYKLSAEDVNGNESSFALVTPEQTADADGQTVVFALHGVHPNPSRGRGLHVRFDLPSGAPARLELHDVSGRRVLTRSVGPLGPGRHTVNLAEGRRVAAGIYWLSLSQGSQQQRTRVAVIN